MPPAMPKSASRASPGPFTTQPMTATVMSRFRFRTRSSTRVARPMRSISVRPQVGQETNFTPPLRTPAAFRIAMPAVTSRTGSAVRETRIVLPMPSMRRVPMPTADWMVPLYSVPVSVTPRCRGNGKVSAARR